MYFVLWGKLINYEFKRRFKNDVYYKNFLFARYLLDHGASVSAVNNDGELAIDISESDEMEELLQKEIDNQVIADEIIFEKYTV